MTHPAQVYAALDEAEQAVLTIFHGQGRRVNAERYVRLPPGSAV